MLTDAFNTFDNGASLTGVAAGGTQASTYTIDLSQVRDLGAADVPFSVDFSQLPASATGGATVTAALQTSSDNVNWQTIEDSGAQPVTNFTASEYWLFRGTMPTGVLRYLRVLYTVSAVLTAGAVTAQIGGPPPRRKSYARNYAA